MEFTAIIQARTSSTRFPNKVLADVCGKPLLQRVIDRTRMCKVQEVVLAIPDTIANDKLRDFDVPFYRGSEEDVLARYFHTAKKFGAQYIIRITGDCPLLDPQIINMLISYYICSDLDYMGFTGLPNGVSGEVFSLKALVKAHKNAKLPHEREHVTPYLYTDSNVHFEKKWVIGTLNRPDIRLSVDTREDLDVVRAVYKHFSPREDFSTEEVIRFLDQHPEIKQINAHVRQKGLGE